MTKYLLPPKQKIILALFLASLVCVFETSLVLNEPSLGINWQQKGDSLVVASVVHDGPAYRAGITKGMKFVVIGAAESHKNLSAVDYIEEPDGIEDYQRLNQFFLGQSTLSKILSQRDVWLEAENKVRFELVATQRSLLALPFVYWFQLLCGLTALVAGISIYAFKPQNLVARIYLLNGVAFTMVTFAAAMYSSRELAIDGELFRVLSFINHAGSLLFAATFASLVWHIPQRLGSFPITIVLVTLALMISLLEEIQWYANTSTEWFQIAIFIALLASIVFAVIQWARNKSHPTNRLMLKWILWSLLIPGILFVNLVILFHWLKIDLVVSQGYSFGFILLMYIAISSGVSRHALFTLDKWWNKIWSWMLAGVIFITVDLLLVSALNWAESTSAVLSLSILGFAYFPLRQMLISKMLKSKEAKLEDLFPDILSLVAVADDESKLMSKWEGMLRKAFLPMSFRIAPQELVRDVCILDNGERLCVPDIGVGQGYILEYPDEGRRFFTEKDVTFISTLVQMIAKALHDAHAYNKGMKDERSRMTEDLHDNLGSKLLSLVYKSENEEQKVLAKQAMQGLREIISFSQKSGALHGGGISSWRDECKKRAIESNIKLEWRQRFISDNHLLPQQIYEAMSNVLREALSNAIKYGEGEIHIRVQLRSNKLFISVRNNGALLNMENAQGIGRRNIEKRVAALGGKVRWRAGKMGGCHLAFCVPMGVEYAK